MRKRIRAKSLRRNQEGSSNQKNHQHQTGNIKGRVVGTVSDPGLSQALGKTGKPKGSGEQGHEETASNRISERANTEH